MSFVKNILEVGGKLQATIPNPSNPFNHYLQNSEENSVFLTPTTELEILEIFKTLKTSIVLL